MADILCPNANIPCDTGREAVLHRKSRNCFGIEAVCKYGRTHPRLSKASQLPTKTSVVKISGERGASSGLPLVAVPKYRSEQVEPVDP